MKQYKFKYIFLVLLAINSLNAQEYSNKKKASFKVSKNAVLVIDASYTDIIIETWNKNTVAIEGTITVIGLEKKEANEIMKNWNFEALGNKNKVQITSKSNERVFITDVAMDFDFGDFNFPEIDIDLEALSKIEWRHIDIPEINFEELKNLETHNFEIFEKFDFSKYKNDSSYVIEWKERISDGIDKLKNSDWRIRIDSLKNSIDFKTQLEVLKEEMKQLAKQSKEESKRILLENKEWQHELKRAKVEVERAKEEVKRVLVEVQREWSRNKGDSISVLLENSSHRTFNKRHVNARKNIKKQLKIKVPSNIKFDLNIRHGKVLLPKGANHVSASVYYGEFISEGLGEGMHTIQINHAPVKIRSVKSGSISLKNVPYAWVGTLSNANLFVDSSELIIDEIQENCSLNQKFGSVSVGHISQDFKRLNIVLDYAKGTFSFAGTPQSFIISSKESKISKPVTFINTSAIKKDGVEIESGYHLNENSANSLILTGIYSTVTIE
ncbi:MAG: hypothetical protein COB81_07380 [Flavobacteriaceae bacterium]|nr:MAG: hypothetical protein COB81_07380 [Flavobacteriaceae bacterium]